MTKCKTKPEPATAKAAHPSTETSTATNAQPTPESTCDIPKLPPEDTSNLTRVAEPASATETRVPEPTADPLETSTRDPEPTESAPENSTRDSSLEYGNFTRAARILGGQTRSEYERSRLNVSIIPAQRQQLDALTNEWDCTLTEAVRLVIEIGLRRIMHGPVEPEMAPNTAA